MRRHSLFEKLLAFGFLTGALAFAMPGLTQAEPPPVSSAEPTVYAGLNEDLELIKEEDSVSVAPDREESVPVTSAVVFVMTGEDIRRSGATDLATILRRIPRMEVIRRATADFDVRIRDDNRVLANRLLLLVDGRSIANDAQDTMNRTLLPVALPEIRRIEVFNGPAAALYGFDAFDCVINIVTTSVTTMQGAILQLDGDRITSGGGRGDFRNQRAQ